MMNKQINISLLNKGNSDLASRIEQINQILVTQKPTVLVVNKLNMYKKDTAIKYLFHNYTMEYDSLDQTDGGARTAILISNQLKYKRRKYLESPGIASVWVQINDIGKKPVLLQGLYRQFQRIKHKGTLSYKSQYERWELILQKWEKAINEHKEIITCGDLNLNKLGWGKPPAQINDYEKAQAPMVSTLQERIINKGHIVLNSRPTKIPKTNTEKPSCIDLIITNTPELIVNHDTDTDTFSDHAMVTATRRSKPLKALRNMIKIRSYKDFNVTEYRESIINHHLYIETIMEHDTNRIAGNLRQIIQESLDPVAPVRLIQLSNRAQTKLTIKTRQLLADREIALKEYKDTGQIQDLRNYKHIKNQVNKEISKESYNNKVNQLKQAQDKGPKQKWQLIKNIAGQEPRKEPKLIIENQNHHTKPAAMAAALNRQYLKGIRDIINKIPQGGIDPLTNYMKVKRGDNLRFKFEQINMHQSRITLKAMRTSGSSTQDFISLKSIKCARKEIEPILLKLINQIIKTGIYPDEYKVTKIVPIEKQNKEPTTSEGWRPINIVPTISKIVEKVLQNQMINHLDRHNLVNHRHHGALRGKLTQTLVAELYNKLLEKINLKEDTALVLMDQSKCFNLIDHQILLSKMKIIGFDEESIRLMTSYLSERKQYVSVGGNDSDKLIVGPRSVTQGSTLSCILYIIYILDLPSIFHNELHDPIKDNDCKETQATTYVDDIYLKITKGKNKSLKESIIKSINMIEEYTVANRLSLNKEKTQLMLISEDNKLKKSLELEFKGKVIRHKKKVKVLGNVLNENLNWDEMISSEVIPSLYHRASLIKRVTKYMETNLRKVYAAATFKSKLLFGIESWGGTTRANINKIQKIQNSVTKAIVPQEYKYKTPRQRHRYLAWLSIDSEIIMATAKLTNRIINAQVPELLAQSIKINTNGTRLQKYRKLQTKPRWLGTKDPFKKSFQNRSYYYNTLPHEVTEQVLPHKFKRKIKDYLLTHDKGFN